MARSIWNGTITFGAVNVPIKLHSATESKSVHFHQVHEADGARIEHRRFCSKEGKEVPYEEVVKGYEIKSGEWVVLEKEEIDAAQGTRWKIIEIEDFVCGADIDPVYYDKAYYLGVRDGGETAYRLLHDALVKTERVGIGRFVFHNREYLAAIRPLDGVLALHTMRFDDELVEPGKLDVDTPDRKPSKREVDMASKLVEGLHADFKPQRYEDTYRKAVLDVVKRKAKGGKIELPEPEEPEQADDLAAALEASLGGNGSKSKSSKAKSSRSKSSRSKSSKSSSKSKSRSKAKKG